MGADNNHHVLDNAEIIETLDFHSDENRQDVLDISQLLPESGVNAENLKQFVKISASGVYVDASGAGQFSSASQVARFAAGNPPLDAMVAVQIADTSVIHFDRSVTADDPLMDEVSPAETESGPFNEIRGTAQSDTISGTSAADVIYGSRGNDVIDGGDGNDVYVGGGGADRYVLTDPDSVEVLDFKSTRFEKDVLDISQLLPEGVSAGNLADFLLVTEEGVFIDITGSGDFSEDNRVASFTEDSLFSRNEISVEIGSGTPVIFNIFASAGVLLEDGASFQSAEVLASRLDKFNPRGQDYESDSGPDATTSTGFIRSQADELFNFNMDEHQVEEVHGSAGGEILDASQVADSGEAKDDTVADHKLWAYGREGGDTLQGNDEGLYFDGGQGNDRIAGGGGRNMLVGGEGQDEFVLQLETSTEGDIRSDLLYDFTSIEGQRDLIDLQHILPAEANGDNIHTYVKVTDAGMYVDVNGSGQFDKANELARWGEKADFDNLIRLRLADGSDIELDRSQALAEFTGSDGADTLRGGQGSEILRGMAGDDTLDGDAIGREASADHLYGGEGNDKLIVDGLDLSEGTVDGGAGFDTVKMTGATGESLSLDMQAAGVERAFGSYSDDVLDGSGYTAGSGYNKSTGDFEADQAQRLELFGKYGDDTLKGGVANDYLDGGHGDDVIADGGGRDFLVGGLGNDTFILADDGELDTLWDFKSSADQQDIIDISAFLPENFDPASLGSYFHTDSQYVYFDATGQGQFTPDQAIAKFGGAAVLDEPVAVGLGNGQIVVSGNVLESNNAPVFDEASTGLTRTLNTQPVGNGETFVSLNDHADDFSGLSTGAISMWVKLDSGQSSAALFSTGDAANENTQSWLAAGHVTSEYADESLTFVAQAADGSELAMVVREGGDYLFDNQWHHITVVVDGADNRIYIDGERQPLTFKEGSADTALFTATNTDLANIGSLVRASNPSGALTANGEIADVGLFSNTADLTDDNVQSLMNQGPDYFDGSDLLFSTDFSGSGNTVPDTSGNGRDGTAFSGDLAARASHTLDATVAEDDYLILQESDLLVGFSDLDGDSLSLQNLTTDNGVLVNNGDGSWRFTPTTDFNGVASFTLEVTDGTDSVTATRTLPVTAVNDAPGADAITDQSAIEDALFSFTVPESAFTDIDGDVLTYSATLDNGSPLPSWLGFDAVNRTFSGTPTNNDVGSIALKVTATDGISAPVASTFNVAIGNTNDAPDAANNTLTINEDSSHTFAAADFGFSDIDTGDSLQSITITSLPLAGVLTFNGAAVTASQVITAADIGNLVFTPAADANGDGYASLQFTVSDGELDSAVKTLNFDVTAVNDNPVLEIPVSSAPDVRIYFEASEVKSMSELSDAGWNIYENSSVGETDIKVTTQSDVDTQSHGGNMQYLSLDGNNTDAEAFLIQDSQGHSALNLPTMYYNFTADELAAFKQSGFKVSMTVMNSGSNNISLGEPASAGTNNRYDFDDAIPDDNQFHDIVIQAHFTEDDSLVIDSYTVDGNPASYTVTDDARNENFDDFTLSFGAHGSSYTSVDNSLLVQSVKMEILPSDFYISRDDVFDLTLPEGTFSDIDDNQLTYSLSEDSPGWMTIDSNTGVLTGAPGNGDIGANVITVVATDSANGTAESSFVVNVRHGDDDIVGSDGADTLLGDGTDNLIYGGEGNDILTGGDGADSFIWQVEDVGTAETPAQDVITDFHAGQGGDVLDISDLLTDGSNEVEDLLTLNFADGNTSIDIKSPETGDVTQKITLDGVDLSGYGGGTSDIEIINNLIDDGNLQV